MELTPRVGNLQHISQFKNGLTVRVTMLTFYVGTLGPFMHDFPEGQDSAPELNAYMTNFANGLKMLPGAGNQ